MPRKNKEREKRRSRYLLLLFFMLTATILLTSCGSSGQKTALTDEDGNPLHFNLGQVTQSGFYVFDKREETFTPIMGYGSDGRDEGTVFSFIDSLSSDSETKYMWAGSKNVDLYEFIPTIDGKNTFLVMFQKDQESMPEDYKLEKYKYLGYTIGVEFTFADTGKTMYINGKNTCPTSMASDVLKDSEELMQVYEINDSKKLPTENVDTEINVLLGLEREKKYKLEYFNGTQKQENDFIADTAVFKCQEEVVMNDPIKVTENSFFYIKLPKNIKNGYYIINESGMFKYKGQEVKKKKTQGE